jgi:CDGSH-type Zn-finger protein
LTFLPNDGSSETPEPTRRRQEVQVSEGKIVDTKPVTVELEPGVYHWCACGLSANHPYCDGSHKGSGLKSLAFQVEGEKKTVHLCACKRSEHKPFCDGSHKGL